MLTPIGKKILVQPEPTPETSNFIIVPNQKPLRYIIREIGDEVTKVLPGQIVYLDKYIGIEINHDEQKYIVCEESNILAKID